MQLLPDSAVTYHRMGLALEGLERIEQAKERYRTASKLGFRGADLEILRLESSKKEPARRPQ